MDNQIGYCPLCGGEFEHAAAGSDPRSASGYQCTDCDRVLEIRVNQFPLA
jgi:transposase-like protein